MVSALPDGVSSRRSFHRRLLSVNEQRRLAFGGVIDPGPKRCEIRSEQIFHSFKKILVFVSHIC